MLNAKFLDELGHKISEAIKASPAKDIDRNVRGLLTSALSRLDVVTRAEFEVQAQVLLRTREKLEQLEARVAALERHTASQT